MRPAGFTTENGGQIRANITQQLDNGYIRFSVKSLDDRTPTLLPVPVTVTNGQINGCSQWLNKELELIKPSVIVALGSATIKRFVPGLKGGAAEMVGKTFYDPVLDATIVCGLNAQQIGFDPDKQEVLDAVFKQVADVLS